jgi:hypothetical protein
MVAVFQHGSEGLTHHQSSDDIRSNSRILPLKCSGIHLRVSAVLTFRFVNAAPAFVQFLYPPGSLSDAPTQ